MFIYSAKIYTIISRDGGIAYDFCHLYFLCVSLFSNFLTLAMHYIGNEEKANHKCCSLKLSHL